MKLLQHWWKKILYLLITGSTSVFIAACYGPVALYGRPGIWALRIRDAEGNPVEGIRVTFFHTYGAKNAYADTLSAIATDIKGVASATLLLSDNEGDLFQAAVVDVDGEENGGLFGDTLVTRGSADTTEVTLQRVQ